MNTPQAKVSNTAERAAHLVTEHGTLVGQVCLALLGSQREAEEVLRETLAEALRPTRDGARDNVTRVSLLGEARRRCARRLESRPAGERRSLSDASASPGSEPSRARALLAQLKPTEREALVLSSVGELELSRVALACGADEATVVQRISRGLVHICENLGEEL
jgi:RNA polymerase sigma-70 factor, ECF subfamily